MNTKKNMRLLCGFALAGCFMSVQQSNAQSWPDNQGGSDPGRWILNKNKSNTWAHLRLQTDDDRAWNMVNQGDLWWGYAANGTFTDTGTERMRLTNGGQLTLTKPTANDEAGLYFTYEGNSGWSTAIQSDRNFGGTNNGGLQLMALNTRPIQFFTKSDNTPLAEGDEAMRITGDGHLGIGTTSPSAMLHVNGTGQFNDVGIGTANPSAELHVNGTGYFSQDVGIGTTNPSTALDVNGNGHFSGNVGIGIDSPERSLHVRGNIIRIDRDAPDPSFQMIRYATDYTAIWKTFELKIESSGVNDGKFIIADRGTTTGGAGAISRFTIDNSGNIGIGNDAPTAKLDVDGTVKANSFTSSAGSFPDYVFEEDYKVTPLAELENYVKTNKHLPNMPSEKEVVEKGLNIPEVVTRSVENIETIYLHLIRMEKEIETLKQENAGLKQQLNQGR